MGCQLPGQQRYRSLGLEWCRAAVRMYTVCCATAWPYGLVMHDSGRVAYAFAPSFSVQRP
jgi:hypothetical protein